jgi:hypothetical protein
MPQPTLHSALLVLAIALGHSVPVHAGTADDPELTAQARAIVSAFVGEMKPLLKSSVQQHGAAGAIAVCADEAPRIAARLQDETGWQIRRVSPRPRNVERAVPDAWESAMMAELDALSRAGAPASELNRAAIIDSRFRYLQGQPTEGLCLLCHGSNQVTPEVQAAIAERYPDDRATGFSLGELRGAISLTAPGDQ